MLDAKSLMALSEHGVAATGVVEALEVPAALVVVGAHLADETVAEAQELGAAVEQPPAAARVVEGHRPLDRDLVLALDRVLEVPHRVEVLDPERCVIRDRALALV